MYTVMLKNFCISLMKRGKMEVLCRRTVGGDRSRVFLLGVRHRSEESRKDVETLVEILRPDTVFLEIDALRACLLHKPENHDSEFLVARREATRLGIDVVYGDHNNLVCFFTTCGKKNKPGYCGHHRPRLSPIVSPHAVLLRTRYHAN
ncbi:uncharacterized protein LOC123904710 [Trifolium pratense]|uniref:uncharacterized protein LOC123904710 n=1 Tax=Trifolium pratense TaxID=57577 RepID=UPI001E6908AF|nr:uncharacterized protein LOC123904710 [Trifolium pratense]